MYNYHDIKHISATNLQKLVSSDTILRHSECHTATVRPSSSHSGWNRFPARPWWWKVVVGWESWVILTLIPAEVESLGFL